MHGLLHSSYEGQAISCVATMVDLAKQAFHADNFDLAVDIFERQIKENGPSRELLLDLADSHARAGNLNRAFQSYSHAYRLGNVSSDQLNHLVTSLVHIMSEKSEAVHRKNETEDLLACMLCKAVWRDPLTLVCGHTFCRTCLEKEQPDTCKKCGLPQNCKAFSSLKTNVLLSQMSEKWFPGELKSVKLKEQGNQHFAERNFQEAITLYSEALKLEPKDHLLVSNRSYAYICLDMYQEALDDAELTIDIQPNWPKGYYRRGVALSGFDQHEEAAYSYLQCLTLDSTVVSARKALAKSLHHMLSPMTPDNLIKDEFQALLNPTSFNQMINAEATATEDKMNSGSSLHAIIGSKMIKKDAPALKSFQTSGMDRDACSLQGCRHKESQCTSSETTHSAPSPTSASPVSRRSRVSRSNSESSGARQQATNLSRKRSNEHLSNTQCDETNGSTQSTHVKHAKNVFESPRTVAMELRNKEDFECTLCFRLLHQPVTTPCGHVFCRHCLDRCLDHNTVCPLCKSSLIEYLAERRQTVTEAVEYILLAYFPDEYRQRVQNHEEDMATLTRVLSEDTREVPIFICTMAYPKVLCPLHIFEPRYRLMVRQCMESGARQFGMCISLEGSEPFAGYGTLLEIRDVQYFPDGRSVVDTVGGRRFKVISRGLRDGYDTARIQLIQDKSINDEREREEMNEVHDKVRKEASDFLDSLPRVPKMRIFQHYGEFPVVESDLHKLADGPAWVWWLTAVLPLDPRAQLAILAMTSATERLHAIHRVLNYVQKKKRAE